MEIAEIIVYGIMIWILLSSFIVFPFWYKDDGEFIKCYIHPKCKLIKLDEIMYMDENYSKPFKQNSLAGTITINWEV